MLFGAVLAKAIMSATLVVAGPGTVPRAPVYDADFPDPAVLVVGSTYWAYATGTAGTNLQVIESSDLQHWSAPVDPLPSLPAWSAAGSTWAPGVIQVGATFTMYYTVRDAQAGRQCISVATSSTPNGPFIDGSTGPVVCQLALGGSIDPDPYVAPDGTRYLIWKSDDNAMNRPTHLWGQRLAASGLSLQGSPVLLATESAPWQAPTQEGPQLVAHGGRYYLFYGANRYDTASSGIGYATSPTVLGAYTNRSVSGPWFGTQGAVEGPQGPSVFRGVHGELRLAFAAWYGAVGYEHGGVRSLWIAHLGFTAQGVPDLS